MYGSLSELEAMGVDPNQLLGLVTHQKEEEKDKEQFLIKDDQEPEDESMYPLSPSSSMKHYCLEASVH